MHAALEASLRHRGPDARGVFDEGPVLLVHTRLSIVDLSDSGSQPMVSASGRYVLTFNGEIYNHEELRRELEVEGVVFRGTSDTEVLLELLVLRGADALDALDGMFAFALYDRERRTLLLARDALGEKPLYYSQGPNGFCFASEVRALERAGLVESELDLASLGLFLRRGSIPAPRTHLRAVRQLPPGHWLEVDATGAAEPREYFRLEFTPEPRALGDFEQALAETRAALDTSIRRRLRADVPVAAFLSSGVDSSLICALIAQAGVPVTTFTVSMPGQPGDETARASAIARAIGLEHHVVAVELDPHGQWLEEAMMALDLPSVDGTNTWLVARAVARAGYKVACSGVGGDELFFGYPTFSSVPRTQRFLQLFPNWARHAVGRVAKRAARAPGWSRALDSWQAGAAIGAIWLARRGVYGAGEVEEMLTEAAFAEVRAVNPVAELQALGPPRDVAASRQVSFFELRSYLHDQLLRDTDVMSMAHALEVRLPILSREVVACALRCSAMVLGRLPSKAILRALACELFPAELIEGPKQGFTLPWSTLLPLSGRSRSPAWLRDGYREREVQRFARGDTGFARLWALEVASRRFG